MFSSSLNKITPKLPESKVYVSKKVENKGNIWTHSDMIIGPHHSTVFLDLHTERQGHFSIIDSKTRKEIKLPHDNAEAAVGLDNHFATASANTIKIWDHKTLKEVKEFNIFDIPDESVLHSMQLLPDQHSLIGFTSTVDKPHQVSSRIWTLNVENGETLVFNTSNMLEHMHHKLAIIPNSKNRFVLYDNVHQDDIFIFEIDFQNKKLNLIALHKLDVGSFFNLVVSPDGQYWAGDMRFGTAKPIYGTYVWRVDSDYNLTCIAKMFNADKPMWNSNKLLYNYQGAVHEFDPAGSTHTVLSSKNFFGGQFAPCFEPGTIQVKRDRKWETYQFTDKPATTASSTEIFASKLSTEFGQNTLFKLPSAKGLVTGKTPEARAATYHR